MVQVDDSQGFQAGDHNVQVNLFYGGQRREPATAGSVPLRIFAAMPGSAMGEGARWSDIEELKQRLLEPAATRLAEELGRPAELVIEKDRLTSGPIHPSMFREAVDSDVYIDPQDRESSLASVTGPLRDCLAVGVLDEPTAEGVRAAIDFCEKEIRSARSGSA